MDNLYVAIASYRDPLLQSTIDSLFSNSAYPDRITVGCFIQTLDGDLDFEKQLVSNDYGGRVRYKVVSAGRIFSVSKCRTMALKWLTTDHDYALQVDSHSRFEKNWDTTLINDLKNLNSENSLLSCYPPAWYPTDKLDVYVNHSFTHWGRPTFNTPESKKSFIGSYDLTPSIEDILRTSTLPVKSWYLSGAFIFAPATYFLSIKQVDWIAFWGEELFHSLVAYTNGWDVYCPYNRPVYSMYPQDVQEKLTLNKVWKDFYPEWYPRHVVSANHIIDAIVNKTTGNGYFGTRRSLDELYEYLGYDLGVLLEEWRDERKTLH